MKKIIIGLLMLVFLASCLSEKNLGKHMYKYRGKAAEISQEMFPPNTTSNTSVTTKIEYRDSLRYIRLPFSLNSDSNNLKLPESMDKLMIKLGYNPCDSCYSEPIEFSTYTSNIQGKVEKGKQIITAQDKDSVLLKIKTLTIQRDSISNVFKEYERDCIDKEEEIEKLKDSVATQKAWKKVFIWISLFLFIITLISVVLLYISWKK